MWQRALIPCALLLVAGVVYLPSMTGGFIMDDWGYIVQNVWVTTTKSPWHFWATLNQVDFWPLTYTYYWAAWRAFGENPLGYHAVNVVLHALNAWLVIRLALRFRHPWPVVAGFLFLLHPLHVQAVSWIVQFKTLASTACGLASLLWFVRPPPDRHAVVFRKTDAIALVFFTAALLFKTSVIFLPLVMLIWGGAEQPPSFRLQRALPFLMCAFIAGLVTMWVNDLNFAGATEVFSLPWWQRPLLAIMTFTFYVTTFFAPENLAFMYPLTVPDPLQVSAWVFILLALGATVLIWRRMAPQSRLYFLSFLLLLAPALGFVGIPGMKLSLVADHYAYLPDVFLVMLVAAALKHVPEKTARACAAIVLTVCALLSIEHATNFRSEEAFWLRADDVNVHHPAPAYNLGVVYDKAGRIEDAHAWFGRAVTRDPLHARAWFNLARTQIMRRESNMAEQSLQRALALDPLPETFTALARTQIDQGKMKDAIQTLTQAVQRYPANGELSAWLHAVLQQSAHGAK